MSSYNSYLNNEDFFSFIFNHSQNELHFVWCIWTFQVFGFFLLFLLRTIKQPVPSNLNHFQRALIWSMYICLYIALGMNVTQYSMLFKLNYYCKHQQLRGSKRERERESCGTFVGSSGEMACNQLAICWFFRMDNQWTPNNTPSNCEALCLVSVGVFRAKSIEINEFLQKIWLIRIY